MRLFSSFRNHHELTSTHLEPTIHRFNGSELTLSHPASNYSLTLTANGRFEDSVETYHNFYYGEERARGYPFSEDLRSCGMFTFSLSSSPAHIYISRESQGEIAHTASSIDSELSRERAYRESFGSANARALSQYVIKTKERTSIIAGYPWFGEWGRDTIIVSRGVRALTDGPALYRSIILSWCKTLRNGLIPNRFPDASADIEYNSVDATLWLLLAIGELLRDDHSISRIDRHVLIESANTIISHLHAGTDYNIMLDQDGLLRAGIDGVQLTWMDAKVGSWVVTPRIGKPIEVQALWINSLLLLEPEIPSLRSLTERAQESFARSFFLPDLGYCADVIDCNHQEGAIDTSLRPNQIFALGALPFPLLSRKQARTALRLIERELVTPYGLRSLSTRNSQYKGRCEGNQTERDAAYHQGTVWSWLLPPFAEAWARAQGDSSTARHEASTRFLQPLQEYSQRRGGHIPEIFDGDRPHTARGAPFQAWSVSELFRVNTSFQGKGISRAFWDFLRGLLLSEYR
jgi:predicted glycogen debranching enzyme